MSSIETKPFLSSTPSPTPSLIPDTSTQADHPSRTLTPNRKPNLSPTKRSNQTSSTSSGTKKPRTGNNGHPAGSKGEHGGRKRGAWTKEEVRAIWEAVDLLPVSLLESTIC